VTDQFPKPAAKRLAIVGFAAGTAHLAPFDDEDTEIWGINQLHKLLPGKRFTSWFELHDLDTFYRTNPEHKEFLAAFDGPVYVRSQDLALAQSWGIEGAVSFPHQVLLDRFPPYFTNTISWLLALAILMSENDRSDGGDGYEWIGMYGVDMAVDTVLQAEYGSQRPSCEYFLGIATGRGIQVFIPHGADLLKSTHLYGFEDSGVVMEKMGSRFQELGRLKEQVRGEIMGRETQVEALKGQLSQLDGAMQEIGYWRKNWITPPAAE
jgi:hypothetical protein